MMNVRSPLLLFFFTVMTEGASADEEVGVLPVPAWAEDVEIEEFSTDRTGEFQLGIASLLNDRQVRKSDEGFEYVDRTAYKIVDRSGLEFAARIARPFDPEFEKLAFNYVRIVRNSQVVDRLPNAEITLLRQEDGLDSSLIDGSITALINLEDVRVGDIVDYSVSGSVQTPLWPDEMFQVASVEWPIPMARMHFKLMVPEDLKITTRSISTDIEPAVSVHDGWTTYELDIRDPDPKPIEQNVPTDWIAYGTNVFTSMETWSDVVDWAIPLFTVDESLPADFITRLDGIASTYSRPQDRATHVLRLVQEDIRYLGIELGLGSHVPRAPAVTLQRGYGDCKDKSVLLVSALKHLGIGAIPVLASTIYGEILPQLPPTIGGFNHVVVAFEVDGQEYWVDPTLTHQGGRAETLAPLGYGHVLPIRPEQSELVELDLPLAEEPTFEIAETFEFPDSGNVGMRLTVDYTYRDALADIGRLQVTGVGRENMARNFLDYYAANYEGLTESQAMDISDDLEANELALHLQYEMDSGTFSQTDFGKNLPVFATAVQGILPRLVEAQRTAPLGLPYGTFARHLIRIVTPGRQLPVPESTSKSEEGISYTREFRGDGETFEMELSLIVKGKVADLDSISAVTDLADEVYTDSELSLRISAARPTLASELGLAEPLDAESENAIMEARVQFSRREYVKVLTTLNALVAKHEEDTKFRGFFAAISSRRDGPPRQRTSCTQTVRRGLCPVRADSGGQLLPVYRQFGKERRKRQGCSDDRSHADPPPGVRDKRRHGLVLGFLENPDAGGAEFRAG